MSDNYDDEGEYDNNNSNDDSDTSGFNLLSIGTKSSHILHKYADMDNLTDILEEQELMDIANKVISGHDSDKGTQREWLSTVEDAQRLAILKKESKNYPLLQSANIKYPLITTACYQFAARTYPELIQDGRVVKSEIFGQADPQLSIDAEAISTHMSFQLLGSDSDWEASMDKLLVLLPNIGFVVKKTYYDSLKKQNCSEVCDYKEIILRNSPEINKICDLRRITHVLYVHPNDLIEGARAGIYCSEAVEKIHNFYSESQLDPTCVLYEQHRFLDLDNDGYEEPYIVTIHRDTMQVIRIKARFGQEDIEFTDNNEVLRINPIQYFTDYHFLPSPDGRFMSMGFGTLMLHLNETVNTILNQLIDAGSLANMQTGFIDSRLKIMGGQMGVDPGQWNRVKGVIGQTLKDGVFPMAYKEPSEVLYKLLGLLIQTAKDLTSSTDALQGTQNAQNVPATSMLAMIEQGMKMHSAIQRRMYRALKEEYRKIFKLNSKYVTTDEFISVVGSKSGANPDAYKNPSIRIIPVADPNLASDAQRLSQAQVVMSLEGKPGVDNNEVHRRLLLAAKVPNIDLILPPAMAKAANSPPPDPKMLQVQSQAQAKQADLQIKSRHQDLKEKQFASQLAKMDAEITQMQANSVNLMARAGKTDHEAKMEEFNGNLAAIKARLDATAQAHQQMMDASVQSQKLAIDQQKVNNQHAQAAAQASQTAGVAPNARQVEQTPDNGVDQTPSNPSDAGPDQGAQ